MLTKQAVDVSFAEGLDTKTDPKRVQMGKFLRLRNSVFTKGGLLQKRNGYAQLSSLPDESYSYLTTFNASLTALGTNIASYNTANASWVQKGAIQPLSLSTLPLLRNNLNQTACDSVVAPNGLVCTVYLESNGATTTNKYVIANSVTGQNIIAPTAIPVSSGTVSGGMRVFYLGTNFIIIFTNTITATPHLQYVAISAYTPTIVSANTDIASVYTPFSTVSWDAFITANHIYIAYNTTSGGQSVKVVYLTVALQASSTVTFAGRQATMMTVTADDTNVSNPTIYVSFYSSASSTGYTLALDSNLNLIMNPVQIIATGTMLNIASAAQDGSCKIFYEVSNAYSYDGTIPTNYIKAALVTPLVTTFKSVFAAAAGSITVSSATGLVNGMFLVDQTTPTNIAVGTTFTVVGTTLTLSINTAGNSAANPGDTLTAATVTTSTIIRSVGLASKAFIVDGVIYFLSAYQSPYQPTYILINGSTSTQSSPVLVAKIAYENGGGYLTTGLPGVTVTGTVAQTPYLIKDLIQAVNKGTDLSSGTQTAGIYSQTGINLASFTIGTENLDSSEIGQDLNISGGFLWMYDGYLPVEQNFIVWPDSIKAATQADPTPTGNVANASTTISGLSSVAGLGVGMTISGTDIPAGATVVSIGASSVVMSAAATGTHNGITITFTGSQTSQKYFYQVTYEWSDNQGNIFRSAPSIPVSVTTSGGNSSVVVSIPTLRLTMKVANPVKIVIYRWSTAQQNYYQTTSITLPLLNDTTIDSVQYIDGKSDAVILGNNLLYTTGGVVENINGPASNILSLFDTRLWLVDSEDRNLLWFSKQIIESTPVEMSDLFTIYVPPTTSTEGTTGPITASSAMDDKFIIFKANAIYYINGTGPDNTGANNQYSPPTFITATVGCMNQRSIVLTPNGLMFQSNKGIWLLDRSLNTTYIGAPVEEFNSSAVNSAVSVPAVNQVRFTLDSGTTLMFDYYYNQWGTFTGVPALSSCIFEGYHTFINQYGAAYQEASGQYLDGSNPVLMSFQTGPLRLGDLQNYQRAYFFYLLGTYISPHKLMVSLSYDYEATPSQSLIISPINYSTPYGSGDSQSPYGQGNPYGGPTSLYNWRVFLERQRCMAFSVGIQEIFDSSFGTIPGAGFTLSGLNIVMGFKKGFRPQDSQTTAG